MNYQVVTLEYKFMSLLSIQGLKKTVVKMHYFLF